MVIPAATQRIQFTVFAFRQYGSPCWSRTSTSGVKVLCSTIALRGYKKNAEDLLAGRSKSFIPCFTRAPLSLIPIGTILDWQSSLGKYSRRRASLRSICPFGLAHGVGFEPTELLRSSVFKTEALDHSANRADKREWQVFGGVAIPYEEHDRPFGQPFKIVALSGWAKDMESNHDPRIKPQYNPLRHRCAYKTLLQRTNKISDLHQLVIPKAEHLFPYAA